MPDKVLTIIHIHRDVKTYIIALIFSGNGVNLI